MNVSVYAESPEQFAKSHDRKFEKAVSKRMAELALMSRAFNWESNDQSRAEASESVRHKFTERWGTDRLFGFFAIYLDNGEIEVDVHKHTARAFTKRARLEYREVAYRIWSLGTCHPDADDAGAWLLDSLKTSLPRYFPGRWVDWASVELLFKHISWKAMMTCTLRNQT